VAITKISSNKESCHLGGCSARPWKSKMQYMQEFCGK